MRSLRLGSEAAVKSGGAAEDTPVPFVRLVNRLWLWWVLSFVTKCKLLSLYATQGKLFFFFIAELRGLTAVGEKLLYSLGDTAANTPVSCIICRTGGHMVAVMGVVFCNKIKVDVSLCNSRKMIYLWWR